MSFLSASNKSGSASAFRMKLLGGICFVLVAGLLLAGALWFAVFAVPGEAPLHPTMGDTTPMLMSANVKIVTAEGLPAAGALVTLDNNQQVTANQEGKANFEHVMLHDHFLDITYGREHYRQRWHVHSAETAVELGLSLESRRNYTFLFGGGLVLWMVLLVGLAVRRRRKLLRAIQPSGPVPGRPLGGFKRLAATASLAVPAGLLFAACALLTVLLVPLVVKEDAGYRGENGVAGAAPAINSGLAVPANLKVEEDDNNAILSWNGGPLLPGANEPAGVTGYRVSWGLAGQPLSNVQYTEYRAIQLQPLTNGQPYQVQVQAIDTTGNLSNPSATLNFTGNPARVNELRRRMTGFFDDFNRPAGPLDELKWNQAYSRCNDENFNASFINAQFHAHNLISTTRCDRGQEINRPRAVFDFTGRTGTITFDMDGLGSRNFWYLDFLPEMVDITGRTSDFTDEPIGPVSMLRLKQAGSSLAILQVDGRGPLKTLAQADFNPYPSLDWAGFPYIPNLRRHWEVKVSQSRMQVTINGTEVLAANLGLSYSRAYLHWNEFSYNTPKANQPYALLHWDNFGFDGPAPAVETHNYRTGGYGGRDFTDVGGGAPEGKQINIPDSVAGAKAARLMFTLQMDGPHIYQWSSADRVELNGQVFAIPRPKVGASGAPLEVSSSNPYSFNISVPPGLVKTGLNQLNFVTGNAGILNLHLELDFDKGSAPPYTQPDKIYPTTSIPSMPDVGPSAAITRLGSAGNSINAGPGNTASTSLSGVVPIAFSVDNRIAMESMGKNPGIVKVQLRLNKQPLFEQVMNPVPSYEGVFNFDTTKYVNGNFDLDVVAFNANGTPSIPDYFEQFTAAGDYFPVHIKTNNATPGKLTAPPAPAQGTAPATAAPTATPAAPTATPTRTAAPAATATPTRTATPAPAPGGTGSTANGLNAEYYNNMTLSGVPALKRLDGTVNFNWNTAAPGSGVNADGFSARWSGQVKAASSETYTFCTTSDDGVRLWVSNTLLIDNWTNHAATENCGTINLAKDKLYDLKLEYFENRGAAVITLSWQTPTQPRQIIPQSRLLAPAASPAPAPAPPVPPATTPVSGLAAEFYNNMNLSGAPVLKRVDPEVNFSWSSAPAAGVNADGFSARWSGQVKAASSETYTFCTTSDDGVRLWINDTAVINNWTNHAATENCGTINLAKDQLYNIRLEYFENLGTATLKLYWQAPSVPKALVPASRLFSQG